MLLESVFIIYRFTLLYLFIILFTFLQMHHIPSRKQLDPDPASNKLQENKLTHR